MNFRALASVAVLCLVSASAQAAPIDEYNARYAELEKNVSVVSAEFQTQRQSAGPSDINDRLSEGIVLYAAKDYERASYVFMDIVSHENWKGSLAYFSAKLYLARSLHARGYYKLAEQHLVDLIQDDPNASNTHDAVTQLVQTAQFTQDWNVVVDVILKTGNFSSDPILQYAYGRSLFLQDQDEEAIKVLLGVQNNLDAYGIRAAYVLGAIKVRQGELEEAKNYFSRVSADTTKFPGSDTVHELATLALARIAYEQKNWSEAVDKYQQIPESSSNFGDVLFELGWAQIQQENYLAAKQNFEILMLSYPKHRRTLDTKHFLADLERQLGHYDDAMASYQKIVGTYEPIMTKMENSGVTAEERRQIVEKQIEQGVFDSIEIIPSEARDSFSGDKRVERVENVLNDLEISDANTTTSEKIIDEIETILSSREHLKALPEFRKFSDSVRDVEIEAVMLGIDLTNHYSHLDANLTDDIEAVAGLPRSQQERDVVQTQVANYLQQRSNRFHRLKLQSDNIQHRMRIIQNWLSSNETDSISDDERASLNAQLEKLNEKLALLKYSQNSIETTISTTRMTGLDAVSSAQLNARLSSLEEIRATLDARWTQDLNDGALDAGYRSLIPSMRTTFGEIDGLKGELDLSVSEKYEDLRERLDREKKTVLEERSRYAETKSDVSKTAGDLAASFWDSVYERVRNLVMEADLGMVDIAWIKKDARSKELETAIEERKKERDVLEQDFKQYLKESGQD